jgi:hypothetical protein
MGHLEYSFKRIGYWNETACVRADNLDLIEQGLTRIFEKEGCRRIPQPPLPQNSQPVIQKLRSYSQRMYPYLWVIGLSVGNLGWTIIKASVSELLCRRAKDATRSRLSELAIQTGCDAFFYSVQNRHWAALLEANASKKTFVSGYLDCSKLEDMKLYDEPVTELSGGLNFYLLNVPDEFQSLGRVKVSISKEEKQKREEELEALIQQHPEQIDKAAAEWRELNMSSFERADEDLGQLLCGSPPHFYYRIENNLWHESIIYTAYTEPQQLEKYGVRLLFFQVEGSDYQSDTENIWEPIINFDREKFRAAMIRVNLARKKKE